MNILQKGMFWIIVEWSCLFEKFIKALNLFSSVIICKICVCGHKWNQSFFILKFFIRELNSLQNIVLLIIIGIEKRNRQQSFLFIGNDFILKFFVKIICERLPLSKKGQTVDFLLLQITTQSVVLGLIHQFLQVLMTVIDFSILFAIECFDKLMVLIIFCDVFK